MIAKCVTAGCGRARYRGDLCDACYRRALKAERAAAYTDGRQTWWAVREAGGVSDG